MSVIPERLSAALADRYRIERELGAGGMATVYLAQDVRHDRKVAIKVLKPELAAVLGAERFVVEIKTTAAMSHPHILPLFDSGTADGFLFYVMPYIQGETIREKLNRETQFGIEEAIKITTEVADALDYAHQHGVIHRDIKPENILLHAGRPMVMDFGIALAVSAAAGGRMTETGLSLGTPHYMSPEQATADKQITARSDVYSLASVLYEMLTGEPPHTGSSAQAIIMKIIADTPRPVTELRKSVPHNVASALSKALEKLPADRFESARAFADALGNAHFAANAARGASAVPLTSAVSWLRSPFSWGAMAIALLAAGMAWNASRPAPGAPVIREVLSVPDGRLTDIDMSRDGGRITYTGQTDVFVRELDRTEVRRLTSGREARLSADGSKVAFIGRTDGALYVMPFDSGAAVVRADSVRSHAWGDDGNIYASTSKALLRVHPAGGTADTIMPIDSAYAAGFNVSDVLPGSRAAVGIRQPDRQASPFRFEFVTIDFASREVRPLGLSGWSARYLNGGYLVMLEGPSFGDTHLSVVRFDARGGRVLGAPVQVGARADFLAASEDGTIVYGGDILGRRGRASALIERSGRTRAVPGVDSGVSIIGEVSQSGTHIAYTRFDLDRNFDNRRESDVWVASMDGGPPQRRTFGGAVERSVIGWGERGESIIFAEWSGDSVAVMSVAANGSGRPEPIFLNTRLNTRLSERGFTLSEDGRILVWTSGNDVKSVRKGDTTVTTTRIEQSGPFSLRLSPDGRWISYTSNPGTGQDVYIQSFPVAGGAIQVSDGRGNGGDGGAGAFWSRSGRSLYYTTLQGDFVEALLDLAARRVVERRTLFRGASPWVAFPGDSLFFGLRESHFAQRASLVLLLNAQSEFRRLLEEP